MLEAVETPAPVAHVGFELPRLVAGEREGELLELRLAPRQRRHHLFPLPPQRVPQVPALAGAPLGEAPFGRRRELGGAGFEARAQLGDVARRRGQQPAPHGRGGRAGAAERFVEQGQGAGLGFARIDRERRRPPRRIDPPRRHRHQFLVQALRAPAVEAQAAQEDHAGDRVAGLRETGPREIVVDEALGPEPRQQPLRDPLLQVQVHNVVA